MLCAKITEIVSRLLQLFKIKWVTFLETRCRPYKVCGKKYLSKIFCSFLSNRLEFQNKILQTYLVVPFAHNVIIIMQLA